MEGLAKTPLPNRLTELREAAGLDMEALAGIVGVSRETIRRWERGAEIPDYRKRQLASLFNVPLGRLIGCGYTDCGLNGDTCQ